MRFAPPTFVSQLPLFSLVLSSLLGSAAWGQATTGSISGHVVDSSGALIPSAKVVITDIDKKIDTLAATNSGGDFTVTALPPDHYTVTVIIAGFTTEKVSAFKLDIDQRARFDLTLKPGASDTVTVTDSAPNLQVQGAETGQVIGAKEIEDLPTVGHDFTTLLFLSPGVVSGGGGNNLSISVNGQRGFSNSFQVNGVEVSGLNNDTNVRPSPDAVQEFKIVTSAYAPEFGRAAGGAVLIQTKSGTNAIHGSGLFFYRPTATAANNNFAPAGSTPTTVQKNYGGTIGGPIKKDKAFLFLGYEAYKNTFSTSYFGQTLVGQNQVSFDSAGNANLSKLTDPYTGNQVPIFDPYFFINNYYPQQYAGNIIPASEISPAGRKIVQMLYPAARGPMAGNPYENFQTTTFSTQTSNVGNLRADYTFSQSNRLYLTYDAEQGKYDSTDPYQGAISISGGGGADSGGRTAYENHAIALTFDHTFTPSLLNEARATYFVSPTTQKSLVDGTNLASQFGIQNANIPGYANTGGFPQIQMGGGATTGGSTYKPLASRERVLGLYDSLTWTHGKHNAKLGYEYRRLNSVSNYSLFPVPYEYFNGPGANFTSDPYYSFYDSSAYYYNGGAEIADLLLGLPAVVLQGLQLQTPNTKANEHSVYAQDYWQITPKLNLTYGIRYEYFQPFVEESDAQSNFDLNTLTLNIAGRGSNSRSLVNTPKANFMPRVGAAYQLRPTAVIRAGFGLFYSHENDSRDVILTENYPFYNEQEYTNDIFGSYAVSYKLDAGAARQTKNPVPSGVASVKLTTVPGANLQIVNSEPTNFPTAFSRNYNLSFQQELDNATTFEIGFVGANTRNLTEKVGDYNVNAHLSSALGHVQVIQPTGLSNYNSLQASVIRRFTKGYSARIAYTWSHNLDNGPAPPSLGRGGDYPQNPFDISSEYANADFDVRNNFTAAQVIELPFGKGKRFFTNLNRTANAFLGGWQLNSITTLHSGTPINIVSNAQNTNYPGLRPNLTGNPAVEHRSKGAWFNRNAFTVPNGQANSTKAGAALITGNAPRNFIYGPGYTNEDLSLFKVVSLPREMQVQIRAEAFNVLNTGRFGQPDGNLAHLGTATNPGSFGQITGGGGDQRVMQFGGRLVF